MCYFQCFVSLRVLNVCGGKLGGGGVGDTVLSILPQSFRTWSKPPVAQVQLVMTKTLLLLVCVNELMTDLMLNGYRSQYTSTT